MKKLLLLSAIFVILFQVQAATDKTKYESQLKVEQYKVFFEENKGQVKDQHWQPRPDVLYYGQSEGMAFHIRNNGISYQLSRVDSWKEEEDPMHHGMEKKSRQVPDQITTYRVDINWLNAQTPQAKVQGAQAGYSNYYNVPDGVEPALYVKQYEKLLLKNLWPGVNMEYYSKNGHLESDWIVQRAEDYKQIAFEIKGAELRIENGQLIMKTPLGEIAEGALKTCQNNKEIKSYWKLNGNTVSLEIKNYNPSEPLRIDPPVRIWGTYYGGSSQDYAYSCVVDGIGNVYLAGRTLSSNAIATAGVHQTTLGGYDDAYLIKFDGNGARQWGTYYGGSGYDKGFFCATDTIGNVCIVGATSSATAIATIGAHQTSYGGGSSDAFIVKFDENGVRQWGTYYGGSVLDAGYSCATDVSGNVYLAGQTSSTTDIATVGGHQTTYGGGSLDAFLVKFNSSGVRLWGTYYGGIGQDNGAYCSVDASENVCLSGETFSYNGISTTGAHQVGHGGGVSDAFLVKFDSNGVRQWGTYYGGSDSEWGSYCIVDTGGNVCLTGNTYSTTAIATAGAHQTTHGGGWDAFLVKFNSSGVRQWSTYYGGSDNEEGESCTVDTSGNVYLAGSTKSTTAIATVGAHQTTYGGLLWDAFLVKLDSSGVRQWGTYYGGSSSVEGYSCAVDGTGNVYLAGQTASTTVIATTGAHQVGHGGGTWDAFLVKFDQPCVILDSASGSDNQTVCVNTSITNIIYFTHGLASATFSGLPSGVTGNFSNNTITISGTPTTSGTFNYIITLIGACGIVTATGTIIVDPCNSVSESSNPYGIRVYPNPMKEYVIIEHTQIQGSYEVEITNTLGAIVKQVKSREKTLQIEKGNLPAGMYYYNIRQDDKVLHTGKLLIE